MKYSNELDLFAQSLSTLVIFFFIFVNSVTQNYRLKLLRDDNHIIHYCSGYSLEQAQEVGIVGIVGMVGIVGISK